MSSRPGFPSETIIASAALGSAGGRAIAINNSAFALIDAIALLYTASATVGNRAPTVQLKDPSGNIVWQTAALTAVTATQAPRLMAGGTRRIADLANLDPHLWVYDKATGEMLAEIPLPANATGSPITYMVGGKQYIVFAVGGGPLVEELIAVAL